MFTPADAADYNSVTVSTTITVTKARLTVTSAGNEMGHGDAVPTLTYTITGFVNGDTSQAVSGSPALSTAAASSSAAGTYPITAVAGSLSAANYDFAFIPSARSRSTRRSSTSGSTGASRSICRCSGLAATRRPSTLSPATSCSATMSTSPPSDLSLKSTVGKGGAYGFSGFT